MKGKLQKIQRQTSSTKSILQQNTEENYDDIQKQTTLKQYRYLNEDNENQIEKIDKDRNVTFITKSQNRKDMIEKNKNSKELAIKKVSCKIQHKILKQLQKFAFMILLLVMALISPVESNFAPLDNTANAISDYQLQINEFRTANAGAVVIINFPTQFSAYQMFRNQPYSGFAEYCFSDCSAVSVQYYAYKIVLNNMFPSAADIFFKYTIQNIKNPSYAVKTNDILVQVKSSDLLTTFYSQTTQIQFIAPQFQTLTLTLGNPYLWGVSQLSIEISVSPQTNYLRIVFPTKWENQTLVDSTILSTVVITSSTHVISFTKTLQTFNIQIPPISMNQIVKLIFKSIYTPSSVISMGSIVFSAFDNNNNIILQSSTSIQSSQLTTDFPRQSQGIISYDQVNNKVKIRIKFKYPRNALRNDKFVILYPPQLTISTLTSNYQVYITGVLIPTTVTIYGNNSIEVSPFASSYFQPDIQIAMTIPWPRAILSTSTFKISTFRLIGSSYTPLQDSSCCSLWIKEKPTLIATLQVSNTQRLKTNVIYIFNLTQSFTILTNTDSIIIQFPAVYQLKSSNQTTVCSSAVFSLASNSSNLNPSFTCILSSNILKFSNIFTSSQSPALLNLQISLVNPSQSPNENFQIWSQDFSGSKIQSNGGLSISIGPASLSDVLVTPSSFMTNQQCTYSISVTGIGIVVKNSIVKVTVPSQITFYGSSVICKINSIQQYCSLDKVNQIISILVSSDLGSTTFIVEISNLVNPETFSDSSNFKVQIFESSGDLVQSSASLSTGLSVKMTQTNVFSYNKMWTDSVSLDQKGKLKFIIVTKNNLQVSSNYKLDIILSSLSAFKINDALSILTFDGSTFSFSLTNTTSQTEISFIFSPSVLKNIYEFQLSQVLIFKDNLTASMTLSKEISSVFYQSIQTNALMSLQKSLNAILISDYQISQDNYFLNQSPGNLVLKINSISSNISFSMIIINIPKNYQSVSGSYQFLTSSNSTTVSFTIADLLNPIEVTKEPFTFVIYDSSNQIVGISQPSTQYFQTKCTFPCRGCKSISQPALCTDCYQVSSNKLVYFRETVSPYGVCVDHCKDGEYLDPALKKCLDCSSNCSSCVISVSGGSGDPQKCTSCAVGNYLLNDRCYAVCPDGYYADNLICSPCLDKCLKCASLSACSLCDVGLALYEGKCLLNCPLGSIQVVINSSVSLCSNCSSNCLICSAINACTLCSPGFYLYNSMCYSNCPVISSFQLYPDMNNTCVNCQCLTCTQFSYKCQSCSNPLIYSPSEFKCKTKCDDGFYNSSGTCLQCPSSCLQCSSPNYCLVCKQPYSLYTANSSYSQCLSTCPNTTISTIISVSQLLQCLPCNVGCSTCLLSPSFCTQCSTNYIFHNNKCLSLCPVGYHNISGYCKICVDQCKACNSNDPRNCTQCSQGYFLNSNFCFTNCPQGTYAQNSIKKCLTCQSLCQTCMNATHCTSCKAGYYLFPNNLCYTSCPTTPVYYYTYNSQCMLCQPQCTSCLNSPVECVSCSSPYFYQNQDTKQCSTTCISGYFVKNNMCVKCQPPCLLCDANYDSCLSCHSNSTLKYVHQGKCLQSCPLGYYGGTFQNSTLTIQNKCQTCPFPCLACTKNQCYECQSFAFKYKQTCILDCSTTTDMPFQKDNYCTNCIQVPFCSICDKTQTQTFICWECTYPYVLFQGQCLNQCPQNYQTLSDSNRTCIQSIQTQLKRQKFISQNKPSIPFPFLIFFALISIILYPLSKHFYEYTYHIGYQIFLINLMDYILVYNWLINLSSKYQGQFFDNSQKQIPTIIILAALIINLIILGWIAFGYVIRQIYLKDVRYLQWKTSNPKTFILFIVLLVIFGPKVHKLFYSKLFGLPNFSYRVISVQKFNLEDRINFISIFGDLLLLSAFFTVAFNVFIEYSSLYTTSIQILFIKLLEWTLLLYDSKKPDRGFFNGDQKVALQQIQKEEQEKLRELRRIDTDHLIKMIRRKSAAHLSYDQHPFGQIDKDQFMSVYNPQDYEDVPKVPLLKIQQNLRKGKFRKGRKITIQQKLQRFADSIKPKPKTVDKQEYIHGLIYWKPPKKIKVSKQQKVEAFSEESMIKMLEDKQIQYKQDLDEIQNIIFEEKQEKQTNHHNFRTGQFFFKSNDQLNIDTYNFLDSQNASIQEFQDLSSQIFKPSNEDIEYNDLMNLNYARKRHLPQKDKKPQFDENQLRILYHQPKKRRVSKINKQ